MVIMDGSIKNVTSQSGRGVAAILKVGWVGVGGGGQLSGDVTRKGKEIMYIMLIIKHKLSTSMFI